MEPTTRDCQRSAEDEGGSRRRIASFRFWFVKHGPACHLFKFLTPAASLVYVQRWCVRHRQYAHNQVVHIALHERWRLTPCSPLVVSSLQTPYPRRTHVRDARSECPRRTLRPRGDSNEFSHGTLAWSLRRLKLCVSGVLSWCNCCSTYWCASIVSFRWFYRTRSTVCPPPPHVGLRGIKSRRYLSHEPVFSVDGRGFHGFGE